MRWSQRRVKTSKRPYIVIGGTAYPRVLEGDNPTREVKASLKDREQVYNDPAMQLSEADLDAFEGTEGKPLCVEHNTNDVVGEVHHSWIGKNNRALRIIGRVFTDTARGREVAAKIKDGTYKGLSVGYGAQMILGTKNLASKTFREISICSEPFFKGCHISVAASRQPGIKTPEYNSDGVFGSISSVIEVMASEQQTPPPAAPKPAEPTNDDAAEFVQQTDSLKEQVMQEKQAKEEMNKKMQAMQDRLARFEAKERAEREAYAKEQAPKAEEYIQALNEQCKKDGKPELTDDEKKMWLSTFTNPDARRQTELLWAQHQQTISVAASLKQAEEKHKAEEERVKKLQEAMDKATVNVSASRREMAKDLHPETQPEERTEKAKMSLDVEASLDRIMCAEPSAQELPFLQKYGYTNEIDVTASEHRWGVQQRLFRSSLPAPSHHKNEYDENGERNFPASARYHEAGKSFFALMCDPSYGLSTSNLADFTSVKDNPNITLRKDASSK